MVDDRDASWWEKEISYLSGERIEGDLTILIRFEEVSICSIKHQAFGRESRIVFQLMEGWASGEKEEEQI